MKIELKQEKDLKFIPLKDELLKRYGISDKVELILEEDYFIVRPVRKVRDGWEEAFKRMAENGDDELILGNDL